MGLAMMLGLAFGGGSSASAAMGGINTPQVSTELSKLSYIWGTDKYVQMYVAGTPSNTSPVDVYVNAERNINGVWTPLADSNRVITVLPGEGVWSNFLIASNGYFKAKGNYRFHYETSFINQLGEREVGNYGYGDSSFQIK